MKGTRFHRIQLKSYRMQRNSIQNSRYSFPISPRTSQWGIVAVGQRPSLLLTHQLARFFLHISGFYCKFYPSFYAPDVPADSAVNLTRRKSRKIRFQLTGTNQKSRFAFDRLFPFAPCSVRWGYWRFRICGFIKWLLIGRFLLFYPNFSRYEILINRIITFKNMADRFNQRIVFEGPR